MKASYCYVDIAHAYGEVWSVSGQYLTDHIAPLDGIEGIEGMSRIFVSFMYDENHVILENMILQNYKGGEMEIPSHLWDDMLVILSERITSSPDSYYNLD